MTGSGTNLGLWLAFLAIVLILLTLDLGVFNRKAHIISVKESLLTSSFYIIIALIFGIWIWYIQGNQTAINYYTGYIIEKSLSLDNLFVITLIFNYFAIPRHLQHRVLFWGIFGVILLRGILIGAGTVLVAKFAWLIDIFALFLIIVGIKLLIKSDTTINLNQNKCLNFLKKYLRITPTLQNGHFWRKLPHPEKTHRLVWWLTPLFLTLLLIEISDLIFALDSIPAVFAITTNTYIVYTSNIFAVLGLRSLYFALAGLIHRFHYLNYALAVILIFIGSKVLIAPFYQISPSISLIVTLFLLSVGIIISLALPPPIKLANN